MSEAEFGSTPAEDTPPARQVTERVRLGLGGAAEMLHPPVPEGVEPDTYIPDHYVGNPIAPNRFCRGWNGKREKYCGSIAGTGTDHLGIGRCFIHEGRPVKTGGGIRYRELHHRTIKDLVEIFENDPDPLNILGELDLTRALLVHFINEYSEFTEALLAWYDSFKVARPPIAEEFASALERVVDEHAISLAETESASDGQVLDVQKAKKFIEAYRRPVAEGRPRKVMQLIEAQKLISTIVELVAHLDKRDQVSEAEMNRIINAMGRVVDVIVDDPDKKTKIREGWMRAVSR